MKTRRFHSSATSPGIAIGRAYRLHNRGAPFARVWIRDLEVSDEVLRFRAAMTVASLLLSWSPGSEVVVSPGALLILLACAIWGTENNITRMLSEKDVVSVTMIKGFGTAATCALIGLLFDRSSLSLVPSVLVMLVGFISYGVSIMLYITAQRHLGAARTGNYYSIAPFVGVIASWVMYGVEPSATFLLALAFSLLGVILTSMDVRRGASTGQGR